MTANISLVLVAIAFFCILLRLGEALPSQACLDCATVCAIIPPEGDSFPCYQGTPSDANLCYDSDPLIKSGSTYQCTNCTAVGYLYYIENDPVYVNMELWGKNISDAVSQAPTAPPTLTPSASTTVTPTKADEHTACLDCASVCAILPPAGSTFPCYQGTPSDANLCFYSDPLIVSDSTYVCTECTVEGYLYYIQNDPVYVNMELWGKNISDAVSQAPTAVPTAVPSTLPSLSPSAVPTARPTTASNPIPTASPTAQLSPIVTFRSNLTISGVVGTSLDSTSQAAVLNVTAGSMGIPASTVTYVNTFLVVIDTDRRRLSGTSTVTAVTEVNVPLSTTTYTDATSLYDALTTALTNSVDSGQFTAQLVSISNIFGATQTANATVLDASSSPLVVENLNSGGSNKNSDLKDGFIALIAICGAVFLLTGYLAYRRYHAAQGSAKTETLAETGTPIELAKSPV